MQISKLIASVVIGLLVIAVWGLFKLRERQKAVKRAQLLEKLKEMLK